MASTITALTSGGGIALSGDTSGSLQLQTNNGTTAMTIDTSQNVNVNTGNFLVNTGNVGIGTSSPTSALQVSRSGAASVTVSSTSGGGNWEFGADASGNGYIYSGQSKYLAVSTSGSERMRIDSSGSLLVGATSVYSSNTRVQATNSGTDPCFVAINTNSAATNHTLYWGRANGADKFYVLGTGTVQNATGTYNTISDLRLKENVVDATSKLDEINKLRVVNFNLKELPEVKQIGFIAQEVEKVFPTLVEEFSQPSTGDVYKSVKTSVLVPILVKAIQEQQAIIIDLKARIETLEGAK